MLRPLLVLLFGLLVFPANAQLGIIRFEGIQYGAGIRVSWTVGRGNTCQDLEIQHSTDGVNFTTAHFYPGICGNANFDAAYNWVHEQPAQGKDNYYRIISATTVLTDTVNVFFAPYNKFGFTLYPMPATYTMQLFVDNPSAVPFRFELFDLQGKLILDSGEFTGYSYTINNPTGLPGAYTYRVTRAGTETHGGNLLFR